MVEGPRKEDIEAARAEVAARPGRPASERSESLELKRREEDVQAHRRRRESRAARKWP